ncbi:MAG: TIGR03960 family B12-binding radical SAM protein, partial [Myxococcales bacterium]|nr:TIGR03960 family B12-binding radical SAM protein [Myxococcales bacterium]
MRDHPYGSFIHRVQRPARYLGGEPGQRVGDWEAAEARICLAFPDLYDIGMSHLGYRILYGLLNDVPGLLAERAYAPWKDMEAELRAHSEPLRSLETAHALREFDVLGFSLQYELTYTNVLLMLELGGVPRYSAERGPEDPLVVAGGPVATHAEPLSPFIDVFLIGDGEEKAAELCRAWMESGAKGLDREARLREIAALGGFYVPSLYEREEDPRTGLHPIARARWPEAPLPVRRAFLSNLEAHPFPHDFPVSATETVFDRVSIEVARGCTEGCRFCQAGMIYRPVRERAPTEILETLLRAVDEGGYDEASFTSLSTADHSAIAPLVRQATDALEARRTSLSVSSLRAYGLSEEVLDDMKRQRTRGLTFAPEAGTQRMRDVINKNVTEAQLLETAERVFSRGWARMKLYFMIGLPTEEDEDVRGIVETGRRTLERARGAGARGAQVTVSVSSHVPKPHTPFQWCAMDPREEILRKQAMLREQARGSRLKLKTHDSEGSWLEGVLARGDHRLGAVIAQAYDAGARFDSWEEELRLELWASAFESQGIDPGLMLGTLPIDARLPWDHIDVGLEEGFLAREYRRALASRLSPPCGKPVGASVHPTNVEAALAETRKLVCYHCGVACDLQQMREERVGFLRALGALTPRHAEEASASRGPEEASAPPSAPPSSRKRRRPRSGVDQGPTLRVRIGFQKIGPMAYGSHLDLVRMMGRLLRRAGLPLFYSEGFHPKPVMSFAPALPLGIASLGECVDVKVRAQPFEARPLEAWLEALRRAALPGLPIVSLRRLGSTEPKISRVSDHASYVLGLSESTLSALGMDASAVAARIAARASEGLERERITAKGARRIDVSAHLLEMRAFEGFECLEAAGLGRPSLALRLVLRSDASGASARPQEALEAVLGRPLPHLPIVREAVFTVREGERV